MVQEDHYYAFGLRLGGQSYVNGQANRYLFQGAETEGDLGLLNTYDYGWRQYDPALGRWHNPDPMQQYTSPYCFVGNNPSNHFDVGGLEEDDPGGRASSRYMGGGGSGNYGECEDCFGGPPESWGEAAAGEAAAAAEEELKSGGMFRGYIINQATPPKQIGGGGGNGTGRTNNVSQGSPERNSFTYPMGNIGGPSSEEDEALKGQVGTVPNPSLDQILARGRAAAALGGTPAGPYGRQNTAQQNVNNSGASIDYLEVMIKTAGITNDVVAAPFELKEAAIKKGAAAIGSIGKVGKTTLRVTPWVGGTILLFDNAYDIGQSNKVQTSNLLDGAIYGIGIGVGIYFSVPLGIGIGVGYGVLQMIDIYNGKPATNYINTELDFTKLD